MLTDRDARLVEWIGGLGAAGAEHVMARFGMGRSWAYARLATLTLDRMLEQRVLLHRRPGLYVATLRGLRWQGLEHLGLYRVGPAGFSHAWRVATAAVELHRDLPGWEILSERELRSAELLAGELLGSAAVGELADGRPAVHRPDLTLLAPDGQVVAFELELSVKAPRRLAMICRGWARARHVSRVVYLAAPAAERALRRAIEDTGSADTISVLPLERGTSCQSGRERVGVSPLSDLLGLLLLAPFAGVLGGALLAVVIRGRGLRWTWALLGVPVGWMIVQANGPLGVGCLATCCLAAVFGARWHRADLAEGADHAEAAAARLGIAAAVRARQESRRTAVEGWVGGGLLVVGRDAAGMPARVPVGYESGVHGLIVGATGSGKTVTEAWISGRLIEHGHGCVFIDPKGDPALSTELQAAAQRAGRRFIEWSPVGPSAYNPYARGTDTE
ncbi:MAG TPA: hypothetical protein VGN69_08045, partial [Solirubrobacteraceae bacterium]|nr:hypothetical protein [Solirubrobacteraceae bacterium]